MSEVLGIVAEYNPFHNGHLYHLQKTKELTGAKYTVSTMRHLAPTLKKEFITAGYIGYGHSCGYSDWAMGNTYEDTNELFVPIENN